MILQAGYDIRATDFDGNDALFFAAIQNQPDTVERIIKFSKHDKQHIIDTYELLGATLIDKEQHTEGLKYWQKAMAMRFEDEENPIRKANVEHTLVFHGVQEPMKPEELESMSRAHDHLRMQSLLVRERILGPTHPDTLYKVWV